MRRLVERVEREPALRGVDRLAVHPCGRLPDGEPLQDPAEASAVHLRLGRLPVIPVGAVAQREPGEEVATVQVRRLVQDRERTASRPRAAGCPCSSISARRSPTESRSTNTSVFGLERDPLPVSSDPSVGKPRPQCGEGATQAASRPVWIVPRPEQGRKDIAVVRGAGDGEVGEQSHRLARVDLHGVAVDQDLGRSEQMHLERN